MVALLLGTLAMCVAVSAMPSPTMVNDTASAIRYLTKFGYLDAELFSPQSGSLSQDAFRNAIIEFQASTGLQQTGELDSNTLAVMNTPRCGVKDYDGTGVNVRRKRSTLQEPRTDKKNFTYRITKYSSRLQHDVVDMEIARAFKVWQDPSKLTFTPSPSGDVDIEIRFEEGQHGDSNPFDGRDGDLAHSVAGKVHFDDSEIWTTASYDGTNLFQVAVHEIGHFLGLKHRHELSSVMVPEYRGYKAQFKLDRDDVRRVEGLYSPLCNDGSIDAIVTTVGSDTYVFKGTQYWKLINKEYKTAREFYELKHKETAPGYPRSISDDWEGLPSNIDAAFTGQSGDIDTYIFKGDKFWTFFNKQPNPGYPQNISTGFPGIPDNIDAAFVWSWNWNRKIYFFKGSQYWRYDPSRNPPVAEKYPAPISNWGGLPDNLDDAMQYSDRHTYFFKAGQYWSFKHGSNVPKPATEEWFGCYIPEPVFDIDDVYDY